MLSENEYNDILWKINHIPTSVTGRRRQNFRRCLRKKLLEHEFASKFSKFEAPPHEKFFINRTTSESTLIQLTERIQLSSTFTLDTESVEVARSNNRPVLIQIEIMMMNQRSSIILVEMCHLPPRTSSKFERIKELFHELFQPNKTLYIWGDSDELNDFICFQLFSIEQIQQAHHINAQIRFKHFWRSNYHHQETNDESKCQCESCLGITPTNQWSLQMAVAHCLHRWLDKRFTRSPFDIGLDPDLQHNNDKQHEFRRTMTTYACNDCFAISRLLLCLRWDESLDSSNNQGADSIAHDHYGNETEDQSNPTQRNMIEDRIVEPTIVERTSDTNIELTDQLEVTIPMDIDINTELLQNQTNSDEVEINDQQRTVLSKEERRRIHNRSCTVKQRRRYYRHTIIVENISGRLTIPRIKKILRSNKIDFFAVNTPMIANKRSLVIGIRNVEMIDDYQRQINHLFRKWQ